MTLTPERWRQVREVLHDAMQMDEAERSAFLDSQCASDPSFRAELNELLAAEGELGSSFLEKPAAANIEPSRTFESAPVLAAGTQLGVYIVQKLIGAGGMGEVYRAHDKRLDRDVAIKVLPEYLTSDPARLSRFEQEARATAALNHPNILAVYQMATDNGISYLVEELLEGETLRERLRRGPIPLRKAINYTVQIAHGLAAAHDRGIVHRDLKPENLFITKDGRVKILDFGLARLVSSKNASGEEATVTQKTGPGTVLGTPGYMSPEQVRGKTVDHRADIFAFGTILYEMVTGKQPFRKSTSADTMAAILKEDPSSISQVAPATPPGLQRVVHRCLEKDPEERFHSAHDLAFALEALSETGSSATLHTRHSVSTKRWIWIAAALAAVAMVAALLLWWKVPPAVPVVESVTQLTDDAEVKDHGTPFTDGSRIYFVEGTTGGLKIAQVSVSGGRTALVETRLANLWIGGLAQDGSSLLAMNWGVTASPLWSVPLPAGEPRRLGNVEVENAALFPDGRILFQKGADLFVADKTGSHPSKLVSIVRETGHPAISPDGMRIVVPVDEPGGGQALVEIDVERKSQRTILTPPLDEGLGYAVEWTPDGRYLLYRIGHGSESDLWLLPMQSGILRRSKSPIRLTNGPLYYGGACPSLDGKHIFAVGSKRRGELVRYDMHSHQFVPFLSGISAVDPHFSDDGKWVVYTSYPDHTLWRSRTDGSERMQLTYPPMEVAHPFISPDGTRVVFRTPGGKIYLVGIDGGLPQMIIEKNSTAASWSPDGNLLVASFWSESSSGEGDKNYLQIFDVRHGNLSPIPSSRGACCAEWITNDTLVAANQEATKVANQEATKFMIFDVKTGKTSDLASGNFISWNLSPDRKYFYFTTGGAEPTVQRLRFADRRIETITSLKDLRRVVDRTEGTTQVNVAPDGSPVFTRDIGSQEIYSLTIKWP